MELIDFRIQLEGVGEQKVKKSTVDLIVNQTGEESISVNSDSVVLHGCTIRNIDGDDKVWHHYFKIYNGNEENNIVVKCKVQHPFKITKVKD